MDNEHIKDLARSAKLAFNEDDIKDWNEALKNVDAFAEKLSGLDSAAAPQPTERKMLFREDEIKPFADAAGLIADFKESEDDFCKVEKML